MGKDLPCERGIHMRKRIRAAFFALAFVLCLSGGAHPVYAETMTIPVETVSGDNSLSSLRVAQADLDPEFDPQQLTYTVTVPYDVTRIAVTADTTSPQAQKVINGTGDLAVGENVVTVTVTAPNGAVREYRITVIRQEEAGGGESSAETQGETAQTQESQPETEGEQMPETEPVQTAAEGTEASQSVAAESPAPTEATAGQTVPEESGEGQGMVTIPVDEREPSNEAENLSSANIFILVLGIFCLVLLFVIIAALLLRRSGHGDDPDDDDEDYAGPADDGEVTDDDFADADADDEEDLELEIVDLDEADGSVEPDGSVEAVEPDESAESDESDEEDDSLEEDEDFDLLDF